MIASACAVDAPSGTDGGWKTAQPESESAASATCPNLSVVCIVNASRSGCGACRIARVTQAARDARGRKAPARLRLRVEVEDARGRVGETKRARRDVPRFGRRVIDRLRVGPGHAR